jgi:hypothetical protein
VSNANKLAYPVMTEMNSHLGDGLGYVAINEGGLTKLEYFAGRNWTQDEIDSVTGSSVGSIAMFLGIKSEDYNSDIHYAKATAKARVVLARALLAELEKTQ